METTYRTTAVGVFTDRAQADRALEELRRAGFEDRHLGYAHREFDQAGRRVVARDRADTTSEHAAKGAVAGGVAGGVIAAAVSLFIPGIGPVVAGSILATALGGAVVGAAIGGVAGALTSAGVPEHEAKYYEGEFEAGRILVTVHAGNRYDEAVAILRRAGAYDVESSGRMESEPKAPMAESDAEWTTDDQGNRVRRDTMRRT